MPDGSAICFWMLNPKTRDIPKILWDIERVGQICEKASVFADLKAEIEKLCHLSGKCTKQSKTQMDAFFSHVESISKVKPLQGNRVPGVSVPK
jgi:hypothetical protein